MMSRKSILATIALGAVLVSTPAFSQVEEGRQEVTAQFLGQFVTNTTHDGVKQDASYSGGVLGSYRFFFSRHHGVEGNYSWARSTQRYNFETSQTGIKSDQHEVSGAYVFRIPLRRVTTFFEGGGGALIFRPNNFDAAETKARPAFLYGGGIDVNLNRRLFLRAQYRGFVYKSPTFDVIDSEVSRVTHMAQPSAGLGFRF
jgi:opacity protein-like surface antigen